MESEMFYLEYYIMIFTVYSGQVENDEVDRG